ncbi:hypothetical protein WL76_23930 [Burkholderia ubonensis]|nr:hypothetical protein WL76_23930 [Burkholderia ubonensis]
MLVDVAGLYDGLATEFVDVKGSIRIHFPQFGDSPTELLHITQYNLNLMPAVRHLHCLYDRLGYVGFASRIHRELRALATQNVLQGRPAISPATTSSQKVADLFQPVGKGNVNTATELVLCLVR